MASSSVHFDSSADFTLIGAVKQILIDNVCIAPTMLANTIA
jgi:hypothetical protein